MKSKLSRRSILVIAVVALMGLLLATAAVSAAPAGGGSWLSGCVNYRGSALVNTNVWLNQKFQDPQYTFTDGSGCWTFSNPASGVGFKEVIRGKKIVNWISNPVVDGYIYMNGNPVSGAKVLLKQAGEPLQTTWTDGSGYFSFASAVMNKKWDAIVQSNLIVP